MEKDFYKPDYCKEHLDIQSDHFMYEGEKYFVDYTMTYNISLNNEGTPFVVGSKVSSPTSHIKLKNFLVKEWIL